MATLFAQDAVFCFTGGGVGVDIVAGLFAEARYSIQLNNSYTGSEVIKVRGNYLTVGLGYTF